MSKTAVIGTVTITEAYEITNRGFATASWWETLTVTPGTYDIVAEYRRNERTGNWVAEPESYRITVAGTIVADFFGSSFYGVGFGTYDGKANAGKETTYGYFLYGYQADRIADEHMTVTWADGVEIQDRTITSSYDGRDVTFHHAVRAA